MALPRISVSIPNFSATDSSFDSKSLIPARFSNATVQKLFKTARGPGNKSRVNKRVGVCVRERVCGVCVWVGGWRGVRFLFTLRLQCCQETEVSPQ